MRKFKWESAHKGNRCGHSWCTQCKTRRGSNQGNRRVRHRIRQLLRLEGKEKRD